MRRLASLLIVVLAWVTGPEHGFADSEQCRSDPALTEVALRWLQGDLERDDLVTPGALQAAAQSAGSDRVHVRGARLGEDLRRDEFLASFGNDAPLVCGEASADGETVIVAAQAAGGFEVIDREGLVHLAPGFRDPHMVVRNRDQRVRLAVASDGRFDLTGVTTPAVLQLMAVGPQGVMPIARRTLGSMDRSELAEPRVGGDDVLGRLAAVRREEGLMTLRRNALIARVAEAQARQVCQARRVYHGVGDADPEARLQEAGLEARVVGEVSARATSVAAAMDALLESPSHEMTLLDARFTDAGFGTAEDRAGRTCLVVVLAAWPRAVAVTSR